MPATVEQVVAQLTKQKWEVSVVDDWVTARNRVSSTYYLQARYLHGGVLYAGMHGGFYAIVVRSDFLAPPNP